MVSEGSLIHCFCLLKEAPPDGDGVGRGDRLCSLFSLSSVRQLVCLRDQTCSEPFEGYLKESTWFGWRRRESTKHLGGCLWWRKQRGESKERKETWERKGGWGHRGQRYGCDNSWVTASWNVLMKHHLNKKSSRFIRLFSHSRRRDPKSSKHIIIHI